MTTSRSRSEPPKPECPLCEHVALSWLALAWHLADDHDAMYRNVYKEKYTGTVRCWCGKFFSLVPRPIPELVDWAALNMTSRFPRHLEIVAGKEGLAVHILEAKLGRP